MARAGATLSRASIARGMTEGAKRLKESAGEVCGGCRTGMEGAVHSGKPGDVRTEGRRPRTAASRATAVDGGFPAVSTFSKTKNKIAKGPYVGIFWVAVDWDRSQNVPERSGINSKWTLALFVRLKLRQVSSFN